jgi:hypothetical protein
MNPAEGDTLDDALELFHNHRWVQNKPPISAEQLAELIPVLAPLFQESRPKVRKAKKARPAKADKGSQKLGRCRVRAVRWVLRDRVAGAVRRVGAGVASPSQQVAGRPVGREQRSACVRPLP